MALLRSALERDIRTLAICRGFQLLNVARGGDLVQHLPEQVGHDVHKNVPESSPCTRWRSRRSRASGRSSRSFARHLAPPPGTGPFGRRARRDGLAADGTLEAVEDPRQRFALGVQWHPEAGEDQALFDALVAEAREYRTAREQ